MTVTEPRHTEAWRASPREDARAAPAPEPERCEQCHAPLAEDQEWCLECGSARTLIYAAPDWRVPVAIALVVILIAIGGFAFAITQLSGSSADAAGSVRAAVGVGSRLSSAAAPDAAGAASGSRVPALTVHRTGAKPGGIADWPVGLSGWTVVLSEYTSRTRAYARAGAVAPTGIPVGVFDSDEHPAMKPGFWVVFSGRFPNRDEARQAAAQLVGDGYSSAGARQVARPGGL